MNPRIPDLSAQYPITLETGDVLEWEDAQEIVRLLTHPIRSRHACISKGQLHEVIEQLIAHNVMLEKRVKHLQEQLDVR